MQRTTIQWATHTVNPIRARVAGSTATKGGYAGGVGHYCEKVSPGCRGCYSSAIQPRFGLPQFQEQRGPNAPDVFFDVSKLSAVLRARAPAKIFWCDMTDLFGEWVPDEWIAACFGVMAATPQHTHQLLTKRAARAREFFGWLAGDALFDGDNALAPIVQRRCGDAAEMAGVPIYRIGRAGRSPWNDSNPSSWPLPNVHLGVSCEDQQRADERIPDLIHCPAAVHWVSAEPLLGPIDFRRWLEIDRLVSTGRWVRSGFLPEIDWIVVGGESGRRARSFDLAWARDIVEQCHVAGTSVFIKQLGACPVWTTHPGPDGETERIKYADSHGGDPTEWPPDLRVREFPA